MGVPKRVATRTKGDSFLLGPRRSRASQAPSSLTRSPTTTDSHRVWWVHACASVDWSAESRFANSRETSTWSHRSFPNSKRARRKPSVATFYSICAALDISIDELFNLRTTDGTGGPRRPPTAVPTPLTITGLTPRKVPPPRPEVVFVTKAGHQPVVRPNERKVLASILCDLGVLDFLASRQDRFHVRALRGRRQFTLRIGSFDTRDGVRFIIKGTLHNRLGIRYYELNAGDSSALTRVAPIVFTTWATSPLRRFGST